MDWSPLELRTGYVGLPDLQGRVGDLAGLAWRLPDWMDDARCADADPAVFFPEKGESADPARRICRACDVRDECLAFALSEPETYGVAGIFAGTTAAERRRLVRDRDAAA